MKRAPILLVLGSFTCVLRVGPNHVDQHVEAESRLRSLTQAIIDTHTGVVVDSEKRHYTALK